MGVKGLWNVLEPVGRRVNIETIANKRLAIDASIWVFQFMRAMRDERGEMIPNAHLLGFFKRITRLLYHRVWPVFVFDGATPALKRMTNAARRRRRERQEILVRRTAEKLLLNQLKKQVLLNVKTQTCNPPLISSSSFGSNDQEEDLLLTTEREEALEKELENYSINGRNVKRRKISSNHIVKPRDINDNGGDNDDKDRDHDSNRYNVTNASTCKFDLEIALAMDSEFSAEKEREGQTGAGQERRRRKRGSEKGGQEEVVETRLDSDICSHCINVFDINHDVGHAVVGNRINDSNGSDSNGNETKKDTRKFNKKEHSMNDDSSAKTTSKVNRLLASINDAEPDPIAFAEALEELEQEIMELQDGKEEGKKEERRKRRANHAEGKCRIKILDPTVKNLKLREIKDIPISHRISLGDNDDDYKISDDDDDDNDDDDNDDDD
eukprot:CAMPEP_0175047742 /NCGR_PEP_ID=MMETSP0052_2-20121109/5774_1 /TAXON_ID=51329 ORGANISM="Polytomella parva, Strain SAG 63-3" /NCGR_SAMPLE_ID=MMETSP0052_2 /ASSEMBLY_ACC=CAM_ASM_000194 /LENGTH=438 /DNA_ID=CAMNT_0016311671 /DNA_START=246 /DNA_END=1559 /DNA_ORIENTATION=+